MGLISTGRLCFYGTTLSSFETNRNMLLDNLVIALVSVHLKKKLKKTVQPCHNWEETKKTINVP